MEHGSILIVDDSETSRMIIKRCFMIAGYGESDFYEAEDGLKALSFLSRQTVDLIVSDLKMPKMDGSTFIKKIRLNEKTANIPVVIISSIGNEAMEENLKEYNVRAIVKKPVSPAKIIDIMEE
ncbi:MAG: response regulator [Spirochaetales bacterium]|nr:response regulator [Spirochaetales bacterium]